MSESMEELARRLVVGRKRDGRSVYDEVAKAELVAACGKPGASVSRLARECGVNANQLSRWVREHSQRLQRSLTAPPATSAAFLAVPLEVAPPMPLTSVEAPPAVRLGLQARLPNGVVVELRECDLHQAAEVIEALGRVRCSASTKR
ncbi:IS66-like element accessory protein TnpA [Piscinibacter koreensis]|uniref:Transposase n=1 Tax=Piscinibacter koreensis TaxID=2742824 RepID=A0A7Y6NSU3_9BURK|nr:transposase [Schlegelella koreensis]NUZ08669.1 transposase [Schlegelella koreensis]